MAGAVDVRFTLKICSNGVRIQAVACVRIFRKMENSLSTSALLCWRRRSGAFTPSVAWRCRCGGTSPQPNRRSGPRLSLEGYARHKVGRHHLRLGHLVSSVATVRMRLEKRSHGCPFLVFFNIGLVQTRLDVFIYVIPACGGYFHDA